MSNLLDQCSHQLLETAPQIIRSIRREMRSRRSSDLSVPQFRTLAFVHNNQEPSLSELAEHLGLTLASVSKLVDGLVKKNLLLRVQATTDRRRLILTLTKQGESIYDVARMGTQAHLSNLLGKLSRDELTIISKAFEIMHPIFASEKNS
ncbi:MAG: MarR family transcriptional regulator [Anaerolineales bacterium]